ncbi:hypothetical protein H1C71_040931, partial [Ictidomys tridecemlineatus]
EGPAPFQKCNRYSSTSSLNLRASASMVQTVCQGFHPCDSSESHSKSRCRCYCHCFIDAEKEAQQLSQGHSVSRVRLDVQRSLKHRPSDHEHNLFKSPDANEKRRYERRVRER